MGGVVIKVSIILTSYNIEKYIDRCILSICNQTLKEIEIIIVDDGSNDNTKDIIKKYQLLDIRIVPLLFEVNTPGGVGYAANAGIKIAQGEYIGFADGDDWYELNMYKALYELGKEFDADIVIGNYCEYNESTNEYIKPSDNNKWPINKTPRLLKGVGAKKSILKFTPVPWRKLYKRQLIKDEAILFPEGDFFFEDNPFHWETTLKAKSFVLDNCIYCYHRINRVGQTMSTTDLKLLAMYSHHYAIFDFIELSNQLSTYQYELSEWLIGNSEWISKKIDKKYRSTLFDSIKKSIDLHSTIDVKKLAISDKAKAMFCAVLEGNKNRYFSYIDPLNNKNFIYKIVFKYKKHGFFGFFLCPINKIKPNFFSNIKNYIYKGSRSINSLEVQNNIDKKNSIISIFVYEEIKKISNDRKIN